MVFGAIAAIATTAMGVGMELAAGLTGGTDVSGMASERNKANAENIKNVHAEYERLALQEQEQGNPLQSQQMVPLMSSSSSVLLSSVAVIVCMMMLAATAA
jgi:hypothetical protein